MNEDDNNNIILNLQAISIINELNFGFKGISNDFAFCIKIWNMDHFEKIGSFTYDVKNKIFKSMGEQSEYLKNIKTYDISNKIRSKGLAIMTNKLNTSKLCISLYSNVLNPVKIKDLKLMLRTSDNKILEVYIDWSSLVVLPYLNNKHELDVIFLDKTTHLNIENAALLVPKYNMTLIHRPYLNSTVFLTHNTTSLEPNNALGARIFAGDVITVTVPPGEIMRINVYNFSSFKGQKEHFFLDGTFSTYLHNGINSFKSIIPIFNPNDEIIYTSHNNVKSPKRFSLISQEHAHFGDKIESIIIKNYSNCGFLASSNSQYIYVHDFKEHTHIWQYIGSILLYSVIVLLLLATVRIYSKIDPECIRIINYSNFTISIFSVLFSLLLVALILPSTQLPLCNYQYMERFRHFHICVLIGVSIHSIFSNFLTTNKNTFHLKFINIMAFSVCATCLVCYGRSYRFNLIYFDITLSWIVILLVDLLLTICNYNFVEFEDELANSIKICYQECDLMCEITDDTLEEWDNREPDSISNTILDNSEFNTPFQPFDGIEV